MGEMMVEPNSLAHLYLNMAGDDWLNISAADSEAREFFEPDPDKRKSLVLDSVRSLAHAGYIKIGVLKRPDPEKPIIDFFEWPGTVDDRLEHLSQVYTPEQDSNAWGWSCVLEITDEGRQAEALLPELDERFRDW